MPEFKLKKFFSSVSVMIAVLVVSVPSYTQQERQTGFKKYQLLPVDDSAGDKEFRSFIAEFKKAVVKKDIAYIKKNVAPDVVWSIVEESGINGFLSSWKLDTDPKSSAFWDEMDRVLATTPAWYDETKTHYVFPYVFVKFPFDEYDSYLYAAVTGKKVNVRKSPSEKSDVVEVLDYEIVKLTGGTYTEKKATVNGKKGGWVRIVTSSGKEGYIFDYYLHSSLGMRAFFGKVNGRWMLTHFVSGD